MSGNPQPNLAPSVPIAAPAPATGTQSLNPMKDIGSALGSAKGNIESGINQFRNNKLVSGASEFLQSNSLVAKFAFLIIIVLVFIALLVIILFVFLNLEVRADQTQPHFIDFKKVLNQSTAGKKA